MENEELNGKISDFLHRKNFTNPFVQECITEFIQGHIKLFGDVISADDLFGRLEANLDKITFAGNDKTESVKLGEYKGRVADNTDYNEILLYYDEFDLDEMNKKTLDLYTSADREKVLQNIEERKSAIRSTLIHELTHAAYSIKETYGIGEKHIFSKNQYDSFFKEYRQTGSNTNYVEPITNYISSRIEGKNPNELETYKEETQAIYMLAQKIGEKSIVQAAWNSNEEQFKKSYITAIGQDSQSGENSYDDFNKRMGLLGYIRESEKNYGQYVKRSKEILSQMQELLDGKVFEFNKTPITGTKESKLPEPKSTSMQEEHLTSLQKVATFMARHPSLMELPFVKKFVSAQIPSLPSTKEYVSTRRKDFLNRLSNYGKYRHLPPLDINSKSQGLNNTNEKITNEEINNEDER